MPGVNTTIDDTSPLISYSSAWIPGSSNNDPRATSYFSDTFTLSNVTGATASFAFNGTGVWLYGAKRSDHGTYSVSLDGTTHGYSGNAPTGDEFQVVLFSTSGLAMGPHELVLSNTATNIATMYLDLDFITWETEIGQGGYMLNRSIVQVGSSSPSFQFSGSGWQSASGNTALATQAGICTGRLGGFSIRSDAVSVFGSVGPSCGLFDVQVDGGTSTTYNATRQQSTNALLTFYGSGFGSGQHTLHITNHVSDAPANQTVVIDHIELAAATPPSDSATSKASSTTGGKTAKDDAELIGGLCGALALMLLILAGVFLWFRRRRRHRQPAKHISLTKHDAFDIDDGSPLQTRPKKLSEILTVENGVSKSFTPVPFDSPFDTGHKIESINASRTHVPYDRGSSKVVAGSLLPQAHEHSSTRSNGPPYDGQSSRNASSSKLPYEGYSGQNASSSKLQSESVSSSKIASGRLHRPHDVTWGKTVPGRSKFQDRRVRTNGPSSDHSGYVNVIRLPPLPQAAPLKTKRRSLRNSRILRTGYNIFFAKPGSSNSGSAYAPSTVLTSEISERPTATLSPVTEAPPPPLPSVRLQTSQRALQIVNQADE